MVKNLQFTSEFEKNVKQGLLKAGLSDIDSIKSLGIAVSGGTDSISLLTSLAHIFKGTAVKLYVITVNHRMRPDNETNRDEKYVCSYCSQLSKAGYDVTCNVSVLERDAVKSTAAKRGCGIEEAARYLRYKAFGEFAVMSGVPYICTGHNRNDNVETILMRFFQGSASTAVCGIQRRRSIFLRPMLDIPRSDAERYLKMQGIQWCTDTTNFESRYTRNKIRNLLVPHLDYLMPGWEKAVLSGAEKMFDDMSFIDSITENNTWMQEKDCVFMPLEVFYRQSNAVKRRLLYKALTLCGVQRRVSYVCIKAICDRKDDSGIHSLVASGIRISALHDRICVEKIKKTAAQCGFSVIIYRPGRYELPYFDAVVDSSYIRFFVDGIETVFYAVTAFPFCIRSRMIGDRVSASDRSMKSLNDIFSSWHVEINVRDMIPVVQELVTSDQQIRIVCGSLFGYKDWIVK